MFDWSKLVDLAEELLDHASNQVDEELIFRSAINRLYYGSYGTASLYLEFHGHTLPDAGSVHGFVINAYKKASDPNARKVGTLLAKLIRYRRDADYSVLPNTVNNDTYSRELCENLITSAREACRTVKKIKVSP